MIKRLISGMLWISEALTEPALTRSPSCRRLNPVNYPEDDNFAVIHAAKVEECSGMLK